MKGKKMSDLENNDLESILMNIDSTINDEEPTVNTDDLVEIGEEIIKTETIDIKKTVDDEEGIEIHHVSIDIPTTESCKIDESVLNDIFPLPTETLERSNAIFKDTDKIDLVGSEQSRKWAHILQAGSESYTFGGQLNKALCKEGSAYTNKPEIDGKNMRVRTLALKSNGNNEVRGASALLKLDRYWGIGEPTSTPLWHSGFSVTFRAPTEADFIELKRIIDSDKIKLGRDSYGPLYSNYTCYAQDRLLDFMVKFIHNTSLALPSNDITDIKNYIKPQDINLMVCGIMKARYPNGFLYKRACCNNPGKCDHVDEGKLFLDAITHVDMNALTPSQKSHMSKTKVNSHTVESVIEYQNAMGVFCESSFTITNKSGRKLKFDLAVPSSPEWIKAGYIWIENIVNTIESAIKDADTLATRNKYIELHAKTSRMRTYAHWIKSISGDDFTIVDKETIYNCLDSLSSDEETILEYEKNISNYIDKSTMAIVGIDVYKCPMCNTEQTDNIKYSRFNRIIPLDLVKIFFDLTRWLEVKISQR